MSSENTSIAHGHLVHSIHQLGNGVSPQYSVECGPFSSVLPQCGHALKDSRCTADASGVRMALAHDIVGIGDVPYISTSDLYDKQFNWSEHRLQIIVFMTIYDRA
jgi:hypothetical protein